MTANELIALLAALPQDAEVWIPEDRSDIAPAFVAELDGQGMITLLPQSWVE